jgi:hypothetical protein
LAEVAEVEEVKEITPFEEPPKLPEYLMAL